MASSTELLFDILQRYYDMGQDGLKRWQEINTEIQQDQYTLSKLLKDGIAAWSGLALGLLTPLHAATAAPAGVPNLISVLGQQEQDPPTLIASTQRGKTATASDLLQVGGTGRIRSDRIQPTLDKNGLTVNFSRVCLDDQNAPARPTAGLYVGVILVDSKPAASIQLFVE